MAARFSGVLLFAMADRSTTGLVPMSLCIHMYHGKTFTMASVRRCMSKANKKYDK